MNIIEPAFEAIDKIDGSSILTNIERIGRVCYKTENKISETSSREFVKKILENGHESIIEHGKITVKIALSNIL
jgi:thymidylate synthase (FAD)